MGLYFPFSGPTQALQRSFPPHVHLLTGHAPASSQPCPHGARAPRSLQRPKAHNHLGDSGRLSATPPHPPPGTASPRPGSEPALLQGPAAAAAASGRERKQRAPPRRAAHRCHGNPASRPRPWAGGGAPDRTLPRPRVGRGFCALRGSPRAGAAAPFPLPGPAPPAAVSPLLGRLPAAPASSVTTGRLPKSPSSPFSLSDWFVSAAGSALAAL